jgi:hypothetical protein
MFIQIDFVNHAEIVYSRFEKQFKSQVPVLSMSLIFSFILYIHKTAISAIGNGVKKLLSITKI